ncbi:MAG: hypothetical protein HKN07_16395 [Acidimicrobiia bacterium]|nr:hypothetical protein [Acidimicrobiia bacterium]
MTVRRSMALLLTSAVLVAACSASAEPTTTSTSRPAATTTTTTLPAQTTTLSPSTTTPPQASTTTPVSAPPAVLVSNPEGVFLIDEKTTHLITGPVALAVDDTRGGVVFQGSRDFTSDARIVYLVPAGSADARELLVAAPDNQILELHDVATRDGQLGVLYTRHEQGLPDEYVATLRWYTFVDGSVSEVAVVGLWESGSSPISYGGGLYLLNVGAEGFEWTDFIDETGEVIELPANPQPSDVSFDCHLCDVSNRYAELAPDGSEVAYVEFGFATPGVTLHVVRVPSGDSFATFSLDEWFVDVTPAELDYSDGVVIINRRIEFGSYKEALIVDLRSGAPQVSELTVPGLARLVRTTPTLTGLVEAPSEE